LPTYFGRASAALQTLLLANMLARLAASRSIATTAAAEFGARVAWRGVGVGAGDALLRAPFSTTPPPSPGDGAVTPLTSDAAADAAVADSTTPTVLDYTAAWCGPCRAMKAPFAALAAAHAGRVRFHTVDIDDEALRATVTAAGISAVPTFTFHSNGRLMGQVQGADLEAVRAEVEKLVRGGGG
jgi:thioredoxin 1